MPGAPAPEETWYTEDGNEAFEEDDAYDNEHDGNAFEEHEDVTPNDGTNWDETPWEWLYCTGSWEEATEYQDADDPFCAGVVSSDTADPLILIRPTHNQASTQATSAASASCVLGSVFSSLGSVLGVSEPVPLFP